MKRKIIASFLALSLSLSVLPINAFADTNLLYTEDNTQTITSGATYTHSERLYKSGWKDVHVLKIDLLDPNVELGILDSTTEHGLKKNVENLVEENGAIAGINADFFGSGNPGSSMGQVVTEGEVVEAQNYYNGSSNKYAGVFIDKFGNAFVDYIKSNLRLYNNSGALLELQAKNKITNFAKPIYFDTSIIKSTADLDKRRNDLFKVVVENNKVVKKASAGEVVQIPENGYVIVMNKATASEKLASFNVGDEIFFSESYEFVFREGKDISEVITGVSAGGEILRNGKAISTGMSISPSTKQPRSAIGVNKEKNEVILVAVDGRGESVGATHSEMANILLEYGAYDAIHLDGGGSTTMAIREEGETDVKIINDVSDSSPRAVPNAIGVKSTNPTGEVATLYLEIVKNESESIVAGSTYTLKVAGKDANQNPVAIDLGKVKLNFEQENIGTINSNYFLVNSAGEHTINATYENGATGAISFKAVEGYSSILPIVGDSSLLVGESTSLALDAVNKDGFSKNVDLSEVTWSIDNAEVGYIKDNKFYAKATGLATLTATYEELTASVTIAVGNTPNKVTSFENIRNMFMMYFPNNNTVTGGAGVSGNTASDGENSLLLSYSFKENVPTPQASYVCFEREPIVFSGTPNAIQMDVKGDSSGNLLKAVLKDKNNKEYVVEVVPSLNSSDWSTATFNVPTGVAYPVRLDKLYVATLKTTSAEKGIVYVDNLQGLTKRTDGGTLINAFKDYLEVPISQVSPQANEEDINVFGQTANKAHSNSSKVMQDAINAMKTDARAVVFAGDTNTDGIQTDVSTVSWDNKYTTTNTTNLSIVNLATESGNMRVESPEQWRWLQSYLDSQSKNNVLITMDKNIWDKENDLTGLRENELLHKILKEFVDETGKNVIVVSAVSDKTGVTVKDGVRYITLNGLTTNDPNNLNNYKYLKIRATADDLKYEICNVYK